MNAWFDEDQEAQFDDGDESEVESLQDAVDTAIELLEDDYFQGENPVETLVDHRKTNFAHTIVECWACDYSLFNERQRKCFEMISEATRKEVFKCCAELGGYGCTIMELRDAVEEDEEEGE